MYKFLFLILLYLLQLPLQIIHCHEKSNEFFGDTFYKKGQYELAILEYEKTKLLSKDKLNQDNLDSKLALSKMRQKKYGESLDYIVNSQTFTNTYLRIFASMKLDYGRIYSKDLFDIERSNEYSQLQKDRTKLLGGTALLEKRKFEQAKEFYARLSKEAKDKEIKYLSNDIVNSIGAYKQVPQKSPILAGFFSAFLPGSGQVYARHDVDGILAFFFNTLFIGSSLHMYRLETKAKEGHTISGILGFFGLTFYATNIVGAVSSANRYNLYHERKFYQRIRDKFFNVDTIERYSEVKFNIDF